jgi:hypothetical protein
MSLLFIDGFDAYGDGTVADLSWGHSFDNYLLGSSGWLTVSNFSAMQKMSSDTRTGVGFSLYTNSTLADTILPFSMSSGVVLGFAFKLSSIDNNAPLGSIVKFRYNNLLGTIYDQMMLAVNGENGVSVIDGDFNLIAASNPNVIFFDTWHYIEVKYVPGLAGAGSVVVKIDGAIVASASSAKTMNALAAAAVNQLELSVGTSNTQSHPAISGTYARFDDLYLCNTSGTTFNDFLGDCVVHSVFPVSDATPNAMAQTGGGAGHFTSVDEQGPDGDTSYLSSNTALDKEMFTIGTLPTDMVDVLAIGVNVRARKDATGTGMYTTHLAQGGTEANGPNIAASATYVTSQTLFPTPPAGGTWTKISAQAITIGFETVAAS